MTGIGTSGRAALPVQTALAALLAFPALAGTAPSPAALACMDEAVRFQQHIASVPLPDDEREEVEATLLHGHEEAKAGNETACRNAVERARHFVDEATARSGDIAARPADPDEVPKLPAPAPVADPELQQLLKLSGLTEAEGATVTNTDGEPIGEVVRVTRTPDGTGSLLVLGIGGFLGIGERDVALPVRAFEAGVQQLNLAGYDRASLERLPPLEAPTSSRRGAPAVAAKPAG